MKRAIILLPVLFVAACSLVSPEAKVRGRLEKAGIDPQMAACMAHKLVKHLDSAQLEKLGRVAKTGDHPGKMTVDEITERLQSLDDPEIVSVTTRAGLSCAIMG